MSEQKDDLIGKMLGQYTILEEVGRGGMATVYRARQQSMNRVVAIKVLPRHFLHDPGFYERFEREVDVISGLEHPHILPIYDYGEAEGTPFIVMRYLGGGSMAQMVRRGVQSLEALEKPFTQVAQALDYAHQQGIIHRDLKPGNIMLDENGNAYLSDFGIARVLGSELTGSAIIGTPAYMSPEQANGLPIDGRSDIYALGVVLFELITGREPYQAETPMALLLKHINEPMPPIRDFRQDVPAHVEDVIARATAKDPDDRYASASEMADDFSRALRGEAPTRASQPTRRVDEAPTLLPQPDVPTMQQARTGIPGPVAQPVTGQQFQTGQQFPTGQYPARSGPSTGLLIAIVLIVVVIVVGVIAALMITNQTPPPPTQTAQLSAEPTPFPRASTVRSSLYTISMPDDWIPPQNYIDRSTNDRLVHIWQADDNSAFVTLALVDAELTGDPVFFQAAVDDYDRRYYQTQDDLRLIDEATAEDGTIRRSYRLEGEAFPYGQMDVFYVARGAHLAVLETYTADSTGSTLVPRMQLVLDSLRVPPVEVSAGG